MSEKNRFGHWSINGSPLRRRCRLASANLVERVCTKGAMRVWRRFGRQALLSLSFSVTMMARGACSRLQASGLS